MEPPFDSSGKHEIAYHCLSAYPAYFSLNWLPQAEISTNKQNKQNKVVHA